MENSLLKVEVEILVELVWTCRLEVDAVSSEALVVLSSPEGGGFLVREGTGEPGVEVRVTAVCVVGEVKLCWLGVGALVSSKSDALKQNTPNFVFVLAAQRTTPVFPLPHFSSAVSRGMTATLSAIQPNLHVSSPCCSAFSI